MKSYEAAYVSDGYAADFSAVFDNLRRQYVNINRDAQVASAAFVGDTNNINKAMFNKAIDRSIGVDLNSIVQNEGLEDILTGITRENVNLISSIPDEYFKKIETIVFNGTTRGNKASSMIKQIQETYYVTNNRAKLIARDQTSKLNAALTQQRSENLGVTEYIWRTSGDDRTRETHKRNNGKVFKWSNPPKETGHPGQDIQCRCVAQPIISVQ